MDAASGKTAVICGAVLCFTGVGAIIGLPAILIGLMAMAFGKKSK